LDDDKKADERLFSEKHCCSVMQKKALNFGKASILSYWFCLCLRYSTTIIVNPVDKLAYTASP